VLQCHSRLAEHRWNLRRKKRFGSLVSEPHAVFPKLELAPKRSQVNRFELRIGLHRRQDTVKIDHLHARCVQETTMNMVAIVGSLLERQSFEDRCFRRKVVDQRQLSRCRHRILFGNLGRNGVKGILEKIGHWFSPYFVNGFCCVGVRRKE